MMKDKLELFGGNLYDPHAQHTDKLLRCKHGLTGFEPGLNWIGCRQCAMDDMQTFNKWNANREHNIQLYRNLLAGRSANKSTPQQ